VTVLMWMRTLVNYQYKNGGTFMEAFNALYEDGGMLRFYSGYQFAIIVGPLSRFGDTAANAGILALCDGRIPVGIATMLASAGAAMWRVFTQPVSNAKTVLQANGDLGIFMKKIATGGALTMWDGALGTMSSTWLGHYPWFLTYNTLEKYVPEEQFKGIMKLVRNAGLGFCASFVSDCVSNGMRVVTTVKINSPEEIGYIAVTKNIIASDGLWGLIGRGLTTKIISNGIQAMLFSVLWKHFSKQWASKDAKKKKSDPNGEAKVVQSAVSTPTGRKSLRKRQTPTAFEPGGNPRVSDQPADTMKAF